MPQFDNLDPDFTAAENLLDYGRYFGMSSAQIKARIPDLLEFAGLAGKTLFWSGAYYPLDRDPQLVRLLSDVTWLEFVMLYSPFFMQTLAIAAIGLSDKSATPSFPRWFCFLSIWVAILIIPGGFAIFFENGPFAWNGLIAFWVPVTVFTIYFAAFVPLLFKAIKRHEAEARASAA